MQPGVHDVTQHRAEQQQQQQLGCQRRRGYHAGKVIAVQTKREASTATHVVGDGRCWPHEVRHRPLVSGAAKDSAAAGDEALGEGAGLDQVVLDGTVGPATVAPHGEDPGLLELCPPTRRL